MDVEMNKGHIRPVCTDACWTGDRIGLYSRHIASASERAGLSNLLRIRFAKRRVSGVPLSPGPIARVSQWLRSVRYALLRDGQDRLVAPHPTGQPVPPGPLVKVDRQSHGADFTFLNAALAVEFLAEDAVRVCWEPGAKPPPYVLASAEGRRPSVTSQQTSGGWQLSSPSLEVRVTGEGGLRFRTPAGGLLREDDPPERLGAQWLATSALQAKEAIFGLGERAAGPDLRGGVYRFWNTDPGGSYGQGDDPLYITAPVYMSLRQAGSTLVFYENSHDGQLTLDEDATILFQEGQHRYVVFAGPPEEALSRFSESVGQPALPPSWALEYHQARWGYRSQGEVDAIIDGFEEHDLPLGALHLDIDYMDSYRVFTVDTDRFPSLKDLSDSLLGRLGARLVCILDPGIRVDQDWPLFSEALAEGIFCRLPDGSPLRGVVWPGPVHYPDFTAAAARTWWGRQYRRLLNMGIDGFWHDMNEPTSFAAWGDGTLPLLTEHDLDGSGGDHRIAHNLYALLMNRAAFDALQTRMPDRRPWILSRSGWAGMARHAWTWTGDIESTWEALRLTIPMVLGLGLSGIPFSGPDIGGFSGAPSEELYLRWFQLGSLLPFFRTHSSKSSPPREPWQFGLRTLDICREAIRFRLRLLPFLYTLAAEAHAHGWPLVRPLWWRHPACRELWPVDDSYLLGNQLLVAPSLAQDQRRRSVTLPPGTWYDYWTDTVHAGPGEIQTETPLEHPGLLVLAGSALPLRGDTGFALHLYPPAEQKALSRLYTDRGEGYGPARWDTFLSKPSDEGYGVEWQSEGKYPFPHDRVTIHFHGPLPAKVIVDGQERLIHDARLATAPFRRLEVSNG